MATKVLRENTYRGVPNTEFIWHGEWNDPEIEYKDTIYNYWSVEDTLWDMYKEWCAENNLTCDEKDDEAFDSFVQENFLDVILNMDGKEIDEACKRHRNTMKKLAEKYN